jgi:hypothetical protein
LSEIREALGRHDRAGMEEYFEAVNLEKVDLEGDSLGVKTLLIG